MTNPTLFGESENDETSARSGPTHFQYYPTNQLTGSGALVNQTPAAYPLTNGAPILPMVLPPNPQIDEFYYSNSDFEIEATAQSKNWWTLNNETYSDTGTLSSSSTLELNGDAQWIRQGKNYGAIELGGNVGDNVTSTDCYYSSSAGGSGFAGWFKPSSYDGQLFSQFSYYYTQGIDFDAFNVSMTPEGYIQTKVYINADNETDFIWDDYDDGPSNHDMNRIFNTTTGMNTIIELDEWNYIAVEIDAQNWGFQTRVYVNNGTSESTSSKMHTTNSGSHYSAKHALFWGYGDCVFGEGFEGVVDELRTGGPWFIETGRAKDKWQTDGPRPLPPGISFNHQTGEIFGTPTEPWDPTTYTVTVEGGGSTLNTSITLEVVEPPLPSISHGANNQYFLTTGDYEEIQPPTNSGGADAWWSLRGAHPNYTGGMMVTDGRACALVDGGELWCWGSTHSNQGSLLTTESDANIGHPTPNAITAGGNYSFTKVDSSTRQMCGILDNGSLVCWGKDQGGQMGIGKSPDESIIHSPTHISFAPNNEAQLEPTDTSGDILSTGCNHGPQPNHVFEDFENGTTFEWNEDALSNGNWSFVDRDVDGVNVNNTPYRMPSGERALGSASTNLGSYDTGADYTIDSSEYSSMIFEAETGDGFLRVCVWTSSQYGDIGKIFIDGGNLQNLYGQSGWFTYTVPVTAGNHTFEFRYNKNSDSTHQYADRMFIDKLSYPLPATNSAPSSSNWVEPVVQDISMYDGIRSDSNGERHMCAIADGKVYCWGKNSNGQLGVGDSYRRYYPTLVQFPDPSLNFTKIVVDRYRTCALDETGDLWCWGHNSDTYNHDQTNFEASGDARTWSSTHNTYVPVKVAFNAAYDVTVTDFDLVERRTCVIGDDALSSSTGIWCWGHTGLNSNYEEYNGPGASTAEYSYSTDPVGMYWQSNYNGQHSSMQESVVDLSTVTPVSLSMDQTTTCALFDNKKVSCFGKDPHTHESNDAWSTNHNGWWTPKWLHGGTNWYQGGQHSIQPNVTGMYRGHGNSYSDGASAFCYEVEGATAPYCGGWSGYMLTGRDYIFATHYLAPVNPDPPGKDDQVLPAGLSFDTTNGVIYGTPVSNMSDPIPLSIHACNGRGCVETPVEFSIWNRPVVGLPLITSEYMDYSQGTPAVYKGRPVHLTVDVESERQIVSYDWSVFHYDNELWYNDTLPGNPTLTTTLLPVGTLAISFRATDDIGGKSLEGWVFVTVIESDDDGDQVLRWNDLCPTEDASGHDHYTGNGSSIPVSDGCIDNADNDQFYDPDDSCHTEYAAPEWDSYIGEGDGTPGSDGCIDDVDRDTIKDNVDQCLTTPFGERIYVNPQGCGPSERDTDGDGYKDNVDNCPATPEGESVDEFGCGESQVDSDGDGVFDNVDVCPESPLGATVDIDGCAASEKDSDGDQVNDEVDVCDTTPPDSEVNMVGCADGDNVTDDLDQDGIADIFDQCPLTPLGDVVDYDGCGLTQKDSDNDMITDNFDDCPDTPSYDIPTVDAVGCGSTQRDTDDDGVIDSVDQCLNTPSSVEVDLLGCQAGLSDSDLDGVADLVDACPNTTQDTMVNINGCALYQLDSDGDGITDDLDECRTTPPDLRATIKPNGCAKCVDEGGDDCLETAVLPDDDEDGIPNDYDMCPDTVVGLGVIIDNQGCPIEISSEDSDTSLISILIIVLIILVGISLVATTILRRRAARRSMWDVGVPGDIMFDAIDTDGDGEISDEEWEAYKQYRDTGNLDNEVVDQTDSDDDLFD